ncbi:MAG: hypothetical protein MJZ33_10395 [Paludibacteraceae bacterium]|nr:hypothetical protein [Paludibacteraceae bacterium]
MGCRINVGHGSRFHVLATSKIRCLIRVSIDEIPTAKNLIDKLYLIGCIVTADTMFCQKALTDKISEKGEHFPIEVKANPKIPFVSFLCF